jgi:hypothetical protein
MAEHFVIAGAQRCGTSYLTRLLDEHPDIEMARPFRPEPKFFLDSEACARGIDQYVARHFRDPDVAARGEKSTSYLESIVAASNLRALLPDALVVVLLRDPVVRALSHYRFSTDSGVETLDLASAIRASLDGTRPFDPERFSVSPFTYLPRGRYVEFLEPFSEVVGRDRLHVLFLEELREDPAVLAGLFARIGVEPTYVPAGTTTVVNASPPMIEPLDDDTRALLIDHYRAPNAALADFLGRPLPWPGSAQLDPTATTTDLVA